MLGATEKQSRQLSLGETEGVLKIAPVHLPVNPPGDCNHFGWPIATATGNTIIVMHRRIPGHRAKGAGEPNPAMSYGVVLRSNDGGETWSEPYDLRDCMKPEDRNRGGVVPLSHRAKFDKGNESPLGYKVHLHAIGTSRNGTVIAINNHGVFSSKDAGKSWQHFSEALREDTFEHPIINIGPRILDDPERGLLVFGNWFGEVDQYHKYSEKLVVLNSRDGGASWNSQEYGVGFKQYEPAAIYHDNHYRIVTRDQNEVRSHRQLSWQPDHQPTVIETNLQDPRLVDTVDLTSTRQRKESRWCAASGTTWNCGCGASHRRTGQKGNGRGNAAFSNAAASSTRMQTVFIRPEQSSTGNATFSTYFSTVGTPMVRQECSA